MTDWDRKSEGVIERGRPDGFMNKQINEILNEE